MAYRINNSYRQRGTMTVEFVIVAPILLLLMLGIAEFGHALYQYNTLTKAVRDGARYLAKEATVGSTDTILIDSTDITRTENLVVYGNTTGTGVSKVPGLATSHVTVSCLGGGTACPGVEHVVVTAQWPYQSIMGAALPMFGFGADLSLGLTLNTTVTMRAL
jgi:Flp pilus assembly protein TadG